LHWQYAQSDGFAIERSSINLTSTSYLPCSRMK
jgi:hypothetical protein